MTYRSDRRATVRRRICVRMFECLPRRREGAGRGLHVRRVRLLVQYIVPTDGVAPTRTRNCHVGEGLKRSLLKATVRDEVVQVCHRESRIRGEEREGNRLRTGVRACVRASRTASEHT